MDPLWFLEATRPDPFAEELEASRQDRQSEHPLRLPQPDPEGDLFCERCAEHPGSIFVLRWTAGPLVQTSTERICAPCLAEALRQNPTLEAEPAG